MKLKLTRGQVTRFVALLSEICEHNGVDALISYEVFSDNSLSFNMNGLKENTVVELAGIDTCLDDA